MRQRIRGFFRHFLKGDTNYTPTEAHVFETGTHQWRRFDAWPPKQAVSRSLYFRTGGALGFDAPSEAKDAFDEYVSDPARPVPFTMEVTTDYPRSYPVHDQRFAAARPDVLVYETEPLEEDLTFVGPLKATMAPKNESAVWPTKWPPICANEIIAKNNPSFNFYPNLVTPIADTGIPFILFWPDGDNEMNIEVHWFAPDD